MAEIERNVGKHGVTYAVDIESAALTEFHNGTKVTPCEGYYHVK